MPFVPQSLDWPADRAVLLVHGIGDASSGFDGAFPLDALRQAMEGDAGRVAIYTINYDFINDWQAQKIDLTSGIQRVKDALKKKFGDDELARTISEYAGDILWPVLSADVRLAVRDALIAQLQQMYLDCAEAALARGDDPLDYQMSIIAHSLGCFHTYETLSATASEPAYELRPGSDLFQLHSVFLMASPVQLIRSACKEIKAFVPDAELLAAIERPLEIPSEKSGGRRVPCARRFISITGNQDPVGGHVLGTRQSWAYMDLPGQEPIVETQNIVGIQSRTEMASLLQRVRTGINPVSDPHSWSAYITRQASLLRQVLLA